MLSFGEYNLFKVIGSTLNSVSRTLKMQIKYLMETIAIRSSGREIITGSTHFYSKGEI